VDAPSVMNNLGYVGMMNADYDQAEEFFIEALRQSPTYYALAQENLDRVRAMRAQQ
jgi:Flp pilus assembly protein TadD